MYHLTPAAWGVYGKVFDLASVFVTVLRRVMLTVPFARGGVVVGYRNGILSANSRWGSLRQSVQWLGVM